MGTGPYRIVKNLENWWFIENTNYRNCELIAIKKWQLVLFDSKLPSFASLPVPDLILSVQPELKPTIESIAQRTNKILLQSEVDHFVQMSAWWYPHGSSYTNKKTQIRVMSALGYLLNLRGEKLGYELATGVIPQGIPGYLDIKTNRSIKMNQHKLHINARIAVVEKDLKTVASEEEVNETEKLFNIKLLFEPVAISNLASLVESKPDATVLAYAGAFQDPEGFLTVAASVLCTDLKTLFGEMYDKYLTCSLESDWTKRAALYFELNHQLISGYVLSPGWKPRLYQLRNPAIECLIQKIGYTTRLINFRLTK